MMQFKTRIKKPGKQQGALTDVQFAAQHTPVESVGDLEWHEVRGDAGYVLRNPGLEHRMRPVGILFFNEPFDCEARVNHH